MKEVWKDIIGYEGIYKISNLGRVKSLDRYVNSGNRFNEKMHKKLCKGMVLKNMSNRYGYLYVSLSNKNSLKQSTIHRLVAKAFIPNPENKRCVNHIDGNKENNTVGNLEWCTYSENEQHSYNVLGKKPNNAILNKNEVKLIKKDLSNGVSGVGLSDKYQVSTSTISAIKHGRIWSCVNA